MRGGGGRKRAEREEESCSGEAYLSEKLKLDA